MNPRQLAEFKNMKKTMEPNPSFHQGTHSKSYPKPLNRFKSSSMVSDLIYVADKQVVLFAYKQSELLIDCKFYAYWGTLIDGKFTPIMIVHYHPSHKGMHAKVPCKTDRDYTSRELPGAPELQIHKDKLPDMRTERGINELITLFCKSAGIMIQNASNNQLSLF